MGYAPPRMPEPDDEGYVRYDPNQFRDFVDGVKEHCTSIRLEAIHSKCLEKGIDPYTVPEFVRLKEAAKSEAYDSQLRKLKWMNAAIGDLKQPMCPRCLNKGVIYGLRGDKAEIVTYTCSCRKRSEG
jgi:hypothetical protein